MHKRVLHLLCMDFVQARAVVDVARKQHPGPFEFLEVTSAEFNDRVGPGESTNDLLVERVELAMSEDATEHIYVHSFNQQARERLIDLANSYSYTVASLTNTTSPPNGNMVHK